MYLFHIFIIVSLSIQNSLSVNHEETDLKSLSSYEAVDTENFDIWNAENEETTVIDSFSLKVLQTICKNSQTLVYIEQDDVTIDCKAFNGGDSDPVRNVIKRSVDEGMIEGSGDDADESNKQADRGKIEMTITKTADPFQSIEENEGTTQKEEEVEEIEPTEIPSIRTHEDIKEENDATQNEVKKEAEAATTEKWAEILAGRILPDNKNEESRADKNEENTETQTEKNEEAQTEKNEDVNTNEDTQTEKNEEAPVSKNEETQTEKNEEEAPVDKNEETQTEKNEEATVNKNEKSQGEKNEEAPVNKNEETQTEKNEEASVNKSEEAQTEKNKEAPVNENEESRDKKVEEKVEKNEERKEKGKSLLPENQENKEDSDVKTDESTEDTKKAGTKDTTILVVLFVAVLIVGAAAFGYNFIKKRRQQSADLEKVERAPSIKTSLQNLTRYNEPEKKPLMGDKKEVEMVDMKSSSMEEKASESTAQS